MKKPKLKTLYPKDEAKDTISKLKSQVNKLRKENKALKSEVRSLQKAFNKTIEYIQDRFKNVSIKSILEEE
jgi:cell division protein FtsB